MKKIFKYQRGVEMRQWLLIYGSIAMAALVPRTCNASQAYGSIHNFDCVNDTEVETHGFEIELEDVHCTDIASCYSWNHYGTPEISEIEVNSSGTLHTNVIVRYAATWTPGAGWSAYTAVPTNSIPPTQGHQFTNPNINFGGEHFGVGYRRTPTAVQYFWLVDNGVHGLERGAPVYIATPTFTYIPPAGGFPAQVQAAIKPPPPPEPDPLEFGTPCWVKEICTTTHNPEPVKLRDLVSDDPDDPSDRNWRNGEPDEVEVEWQLMQVDYNSAGGGANGELQGAPEDLNGGDEVVTRRYEFYKYEGPIDEESGEAMADKVAGDGIHGVGIKTINGVEVDLSLEIVVGDFFGAQMSAFDVDEPIGLIDHLQDGRVGADYPARNLILSATTNFVAELSGALPNGLAFDRETGILSGTPAEAGVFDFQVQVAISNKTEVVQKYFLSIADIGEDLPPHSSVVSTVEPAGSGEVDGDNVYTNGAAVTVMATPSIGYAFTGWSDNGKLVSTSSSYTFTNLLNRSLMASFIEVPFISVSDTLPSGFVLAWPTNFSGYELIQNSSLITTNWTPVEEAVSSQGANYQVTVPVSGSSIYFRLRHP
ncbi:MAG: putative Ig domain-containing protein [Pontiellaceae bacterium]|nr:putative Ig domain-containing protein [Pontiellaceae bacterium]MBN2783376.1 putative Ig domain-containing protein [Pontiellaceae bacterium]